MVTRPRNATDHGLRLRPPSGRRHRRRDRHPPVPAALLVGALAAGDLGIDFDGTDFAFLEQPAWLAARARAARDLDLRGPPLGGRTRRSAGRGRTLLGTFAVVVGRCCWAPARWPTAATASCRAHRRRRCARCSATSSRAIAARAACASASTPRPANALPLYAEGAGAARRRRLASSSRRSPIARDRRAARAAGRRPPPRRREVRRPAHPAMSRRGEAEEARPRRHRRHEARDARAGGRRPGARRR